MSDFVPTFGERDFTPADTYRGQANLQASPLETAQSTFDLNYGTGTTQSAAALFMEHQDNTGRMLSPQEADKQTKDLGIEGLHFDQPVSQDTLSLQQVRQQDYLKNKEVVDNGSGFASTSVGQFGIGLGSSFLDPVDFALNFVEGGLAEKLGIGANALKGASIAQRALTRLGQGALDNLPVNTGISAANWYEASQEQRDYGADDFLKSIAYGEVMGSVIHSAAGTIGDVSTRASTNARIRDILPPNAQTEALQLSNQSVYNFNDILGIQPKVIAAEKFLGRNLSQYDRLSLLQRKAQTEAPTLPEPEGALPSDQALNFIHPEEIANEKVSRLKDLINGKDIVPETPLPGSQEPKAALSSEPITSGDIDTEISNLEKENEDLSKQIEPDKEDENLAPATFLGHQDIPGKDGFDLYNLNEDIEGHPKGSTVADKTLTDMGYKLPTKGNPSVIDHTPEYGEEGVKLIENSKVQVDNADKDIQALAPREKAIRNATNCFLGAVTGN